MFLLPDPSSDAPFRFQDQSLIYSASDLVASAQCQFSLLTRLDQKLGREPQQDYPQDPQLERAARLGNEHERRVLRGFLKKFGEWDGQRGVYQVQPASSYDQQSLIDKQEETLKALEDGADVVFQASFFDGEFHGRADFLVKDDQGRYRVVDSKLARQARSSALLQLAAYAHQLEEAGIKLAPEVSLILGSEVESFHRLDKLLPVFEQKREVLRQLLEKRLTSDAQPLDWWQDPADLPLSRCGVCQVCQQQIHDKKDMLLAQGMTPRVRASLANRYGVASLQELADLHQQPGLTAQAQRWSQQAALQLGQLPQAQTIQRTWKEQDLELSYLLLPRTSLASLPKPSPGDLMLSLESDSLWKDPYTKGEDAWGLLYGLTLMTVPERPQLAPQDPQVFWAESRWDERKLLKGFFEAVSKTREEHPDLHIYYFGARALRQLEEATARQGYGEGYLAALLRDGTLLDLSQILAKSLRVSTGYQSLEDLEPFYCPSDLRPLQVPEGAYADYLASRQEDPNRAGFIRQAIEQDMLADGLSLLGLRNWLLGLGQRDVWEEIAKPAERIPLPQAEDPLPGSEPDQEVEEAEETLAASIQELDQQIQQLPQENPDLAQARQALAMILAGTDYYRRERTQFWTDHTQRLLSPIEDWEDSRDVIRLVTQPEVLEDWGRLNRRYGLSRTWRAIGRLAPGSTLKEGAKGLFAVYQSPFPDYFQKQAYQKMLEYAAWHEGVLPPAPERLGDFSSELLSLEPIAEEEAGQPYLVRIEVKESLKRSVAGEDSRPHDHFPIALTPPTPIPTKSQETSLDQLAVAMAQVLEAQDLSSGALELPASPGLDLLLRRPPRLLSGGALPDPADLADRYGSMAMARAIYQAVHDLDRSYLAVQGPPGSGKTFVGSHVIGLLVKAGWKVGIVAQSHAVIENMMLGCAKNGGIDPDDMARIQGKSLSPDAPWTEVANRELMDFLRRPGGKVFGGTAWDFASASKVDYEAFDLLVVDEAGQYSLANTLAVARAAKRLLLLGDPAQLPQVTQGTHPQPIDQSALGWLSEGHTVLPQKFGYFLSVSWRMHPALCQPVSTLAYEGQLTSAPAGAQRYLAGWAPGLYRSQVSHQGNATFSEQEAAEVVRLARLFEGARWNPQADDPAQERPLEPADIIVVAAYNAQVQTIQQALLEAGLSTEDGGGVKVGTVDKFQGQEAPVVLVSMAASSAGETPRGTDFLLSTNRLNVALSRGMWAAVLIHTPQFMDFLPADPEGLELLGGFLRLSNGAQAMPAAPVAGAEAGA